MNLFSFVNRVHDISVLSHYFLHILCNNVVDLSEGRMQAYGWSLPAKYSNEVAEGGKSLVSVPVPVYCRPLNLNDPGMKVKTL